jgi:hypothetical protein
MRLDLTRRAGHDDRASAFAALGSEIDEPVRAADHVQVVLDHEQRVPDLEQLPERAQ